MKNSRCVGLVGGLGVGATVHYYEHLARECEKLGFALDIVITDAQTPRVFAYVEARDRTGLAEYLSGRGGGWPIQARFWLEWASSGGVHFGNPSEDPPLPGAPR